MGFTTSYAALNSRERWRLRTAPGDQHQFAFFLQHISKQNFYRISLEF